MSAKKKCTLMCFVLLAFFGEAQEIQKEVGQEAQLGWYKISITYPNGEDKHFDMDYYSKTHMPMVAMLFGDKLKGYAIDKGLSGRTPDDPATYLAVGYFYFEELSDYHAAFVPNGEKIRMDIPNYTNIEPIVQINKVIK